MKKFLITIDTEGDNLWEYKIGDPVETKNARALPRFQKLCDKFGFKPVYLTNYEMAQDPFYVEFAKAAQNEGRCEVGMHLHAWNNPPYFELPAAEKGLPYLIEYPESVMREKIHVMDDLLTEKFGVKPVTHRAGRWAMNQTYFDLLIEKGYLVDCSVTPHIDWRTSVGLTKNSCGSDYRNMAETPSFITSSNGKESIIEVPVTVGFDHHFRAKRVLKHPQKILEELKSARKGRLVWVRPNGKNLKQMLRYVAQMAKSDFPYLMFMIHSSELMAGGSPTFRTDESIERLYSDLEALFECVSKNYEVETIRNYIPQLKEFC